MVCDGSLIDWNLTNLGGVNVRTETIKFKDFISGEYKNRDKRRLSNLTKGALLVPAFTGWKLSTAFASSPEAVPVIATETKSKIIHAFDPLLDLMIAASLPIAGIMLTGGALLIMIGQKDKGFTLIMNASLGYVLVNLSPLFLSLLESVGNAI